MRRLVPGAKFFFFSNDVEWVKAHYDGPDFVTVEGNDEDSGFAESSEAYAREECRDIYTEDMTVL